MSFLAKVGSFVSSNITGSASLERAAKEAPNKTGVYKLFLNGRLMKVGKAEWEAGLRWRLQQYWRGDGTAGLYRDEMTVHRDNIRVTWVVCPPGNCRALELKMIEEASGVKNLPWSSRR